MKYLLPIILILASTGLFILYTNPNYLAVKDLRVEAASYDEALSNAKQLQAVRDTLVTKYNSISPDVLDRLSKFLPDNVDNIKLILEIDRIASQYGMQVKNIKYDVAQKAADPAKSQFVATSKEPVKDFGSFDLEFSVEGSFGNFVSFTDSIEKSLRIVDINSVSFSSSDTALPGAPKDNYKYDFKIKTYWLKG